MLIDLNDDTLNIAAMFSELIVHTCGEGTAYVAVMVSPLAASPDGVSRVRCCSNIQPPSAVALMIDALARMHQKATGVQHDSFDVRPPEASAEGGVQ